MIRNIVAIFLALILSACASHSAQTEKTTDKYIVIAYSQRDRLYNNMKPVFDELHKIYPERVKLVDVDSSKTDVIVKSGIQSTPSFIFFENKRRKYTIQGEQDTASILKIFDDYLN